MKIVLIILTMVITACNNPAQTGHNHDEDKEKHESTQGISLNNGNKWKADYITKQNVRAMLQVVNDTVNTDPSKSAHLYSTLQSKVDILVRQCTMKGPDHDALHSWLEILLLTMKELKEGEGNYSQVYTELKEDIESFNVYFE